MANFFIFYVLLLAISSPFSSSSSDTLTEGSSLSAESPTIDVLVSPNGIFSAGFHSVGDNAYCFAVWYTEEPSNDEDGTVVWMANRDQPVNGKGSKLTLLKTGNLVLNDAGRIMVWATGTASLAIVQLRLYNTGNVVLLTSNNVVLWQSFDSPTDTLLPGQALTRYGNLVSPRSQSNFSSGFYRLFFDTDNVIRLVFDNNELSSVYWPNPWFLTWEAGRSTYNSTRIAALDYLGNFSSSDDFTILSDDFGSRIQRRMKLDYDGNVRLYSKKKPGETWVVTWQAFTNPCRIHGICGPNSRCKYDSNGRKCSCIPGHKMRNRTDWSYGCEPEFDFFCSKDESRFVELSNTEFYGYDYGVYYNYSYQDCENLCLQFGNCKGFQYSYFVNQGDFRCYPKMLLVNGYHRPGFSGNLYLRLPKTYLSSNTEEHVLDCSDEVTIHLARTYTRGQVNVAAKFMVWFACGVGGFEMICILFVWCLLIRTRRNSDTCQFRAQLLAATRLKRFSFFELKKATRGFAEEIGRGAGGVVYKGVLSDSRVAAIKLLAEAYSGEAEFLAEVTTIGTLNHMNLIEIWGYCLEGKHRILVYECLEHGSLKKNLSRNVLDWKKRYEIAVGTAKCLAYLHEECLGWVLHCDVKPQNILLGSDYQPKVADFGLSKLLERGELSNPSFSRIRGTRGYMAPEWITNQAITSKVDVYSYGIVVLEMLTGKSPTTTCVDADNGREETEHRGLVTWVREIVHGRSEREAWLEKVMDSLMEGEYDKEKMEILLRVALKCVEEEKDARPTMSQVVKMLLGYENSH
ncbi:S-receptor-like serine/threonine-protein kinase [Parasponia andersonii]|uniref:Receptor-like serine/threonine-protein kinase n=1 Tax=Parasponia andersonii TaxID=3476 RepID=A0A2P5BJA4_PARAD|nr:S-receptor-like serine/threonine-protein kinase [Parasponia andersonii]